MVKKRTEISIQIIRLPWDWEVGNKTSETKKGSSQNFYKFLMKSDRKTFIASDIFGFRWRNFRFLSGAWILLPTWNNLKGKIHSCFYSFHFFFVRFPFRLISNKFKCWKICKTFGTSSFFVWFEMFFVFIFFFDWLVSLAYLNVGHIVHIDLE